MSREILQHNRVIEVIKQSTTKYILDALKKMSEKDVDKYKTFGKTLVTLLKRVLVKIFKIKKKFKIYFVSPVLMMRQDQSVSLADYVSRMGEDQDKIYYVIADGYQSGLLSPHMEYSKESVEVLVLTDRIMRMITRCPVTDKPLQSIS